MKNFLKPTKITWVVFSSLIILSAGIFGLGMLLFTAGSDRLWEVFIAAPLLLIGWLYALAEPLGFDVQGKGGEFISLPNGLGITLIVAGSLITLAVYYLIGAVFSHFYREKPTLTKIILAILPILIVVLTLGVVMYERWSGNNGVSGNLAFPQRGGDFIVRGNVVKNVDSRPIDGPAYLLLKTEKGTVEVIYAEAEPPCPNEENVIKEGLRAKKGDIIYAYGRIVDTGTISLCDSDNYSLDILVPGD